MKYLPFLLLFMMSTAIQAVPKLPTAIQRTDSHHKKRFEQISKELKKKPSVVFYGDSLTEGWRYKRALWKTFEPYSVNAGIVSDNTQHLLWRLENGHMQKIDPQVIVLHIGSNDIFQKTPKQIASNVAFILVKLRFQFPKAKILVYGFFLVKDKMKQVYEVNKYLRKVCLRDDQIRFINITNQLSWGHMARDRMHLNGRGYEVWHRSLEKELKKLYN